MKRNDLVLVIDMQNVYLPENDWACPSIRRSIENIKKILLSGAQSVFTRYIAHPRPEGTWKNYNKEYAEINENEYLNDIVEDLKIYCQNSFYDKSTYSAWTKTIAGVAEKYDRIVITGVAAECCVLATLLAVIDSGKEVVYLTDCISGQNDENELMIRRLAESFSPIHVTVMTSDQYLADQAAVFDREESTRNELNNMNCFEKVQMTQTEFLKHCSACGGNWGAMLLTGIHKLFPEHYEEVKEHYNSMDFCDGGVRAFEYLCNWLEDHGVIEE